MKIPQIKSKDLTTVLDLDGDEIVGLFALAARLKAEARRGKYRDLLHKKSLAMIFEKSSTRTRVSFETGITQLGGHALFLSGNDIQIRRGESLHDTAQVLSRYVDAIMIRTFEHDKVTQLAANANVPVINGLSDSHHPCQALADYFTIYERQRDFSQVKMTYIGDGNNMANSLIHTAALLGSRITIAAPDAYAPDRAIVEEARRVAARTGAVIEVTANLQEAVRDASYLYTDVWVSMGQEQGAARKKKILAPYKISTELMKHCRPDCLVMHCLPAHRGEEIDAAVIDSPRSIVFDEAENRLHIQNAIMCALMTRTRARRS